MAATGMAQASLSTVPVSPSPASRGTRTSMYVARMCSGADLFAGKHAPAMHRARLFSGLVIQAARGQESVATRASIGVGARERGNL